MKTLLLLCFMVAGGYGVLSEIATSGCYAAIKVIHGYWWLGAWVPPQAMVLCENVDEICTADDCQPKVLETNANGDDKISCECGAGGDSDCDAYIWRSAAGAYILGPFYSGIKCLEVPCPEPEEECLSNTEEGGGTPLEHSWIKFRCDCAVPPVGGG